MQLSGALSCALLCVPLARAATLSLEVQHDGKPVQGAVLSAHPTQPGAPPQPVEAVLDQIQSQFVPHQLVVPVGSRVRFPNSDVTRHQVYSFSAAKRFELPLYSGTPPEPIVFDSPGVVTLGCNIHDWMTGYIVVLDTRYFAESDTNGLARVELPAGEYALRVWHERLSGSVAPEHLILSAEDSTEHRSFDVELRPPPPPRGDERMRALQERFRNLKHD
ncbi:MAG: methylamine utilization protein [Xanthomonadales bacterium]|nr:methylamine utilization protein [Xanthomonadales bacterium]